MNIQQYGGDNVKELISNVFTSFPMLIGSLAVFVTFLLIFQARKKSMNEDLKTVVLMLTILGVIALTIFPLAFVFSRNHRQTAILENSISTASFTIEQQDIIDLLSIPNSQEFLVFDFSTEDSYSSVEFWVEVYQNGELIGHPASLQMVLDVAHKQEGRLAVTITQNPHFRYALSIMIMGGRVSHVSTDEVIIDRADLARFHGAISYPVIIEEGKEIVLYSSLFSDGNMYLYDHQTLQERPELLNEFLYAQIIKCKFSK
jgi:hypothetical protein